MTWIPQHSPAFPAAACSFANQPGLGGRGLVVEPERPRRSEEAVPTLDCVNAAARRTWRAEPDGTGRTSAAIVADDRDRVSRAAGAALLGDSLGTCPGRVAVLGEHGRRSGAGARARPPRPVRDARDQARARAHNLGRPQGRRPV